MSPIHTILAERQKTHGDFTDNSAVAQGIKRLIRESGAKLTPTQQEALDFVASKIGRICSGDANTRDHWHDIAGYATLAAERCIQPHPELAFEQPDWHNPDNLPSAGDGYRFLLKSETRADATHFFHEYARDWAVMNEVIREPSLSDCTYRTNKPLP